MQLAATRAAAASRFNEAQQFLSELRKAELAAGIITPIELSIRKGLYVVLLYSSFEFSICRAISEVSLFISSKNVQFAHVDPSVYPYALDAELSSIAGVGRPKKWQRRAELFVKLISPDVVSLNEGCVLGELENAWAETLQKVFLIFGLPMSPFYDIRVKRQIDEIVERRNAVAHGRESAADVGRGYTVADLQIRQDEMVKQAEYMFTQFEDWLYDKKFVAAPHRAKY